MGSSAPRYFHASHDPEVQRLEDEITELAAHIQAATCKLLELLREFDKREGWGGPGLKSCAHWLNWRCGIALSAAREKVRVAHALADLPQITEVFRRGELSYSKVRAITRIATPENEDYLLEIARCGTAAHVERLVSSYRRVQRIEAIQREEARRAARELTWYEDESGCYVFRARVPPDQGALIERALEAAFEESPTDRDNPEPMAARRADALERLASDYLAGQRESSNGGDRNTIHIHTDVDTLQQYGEGATSEVEGCACVSAGTSRRLACDAGIVVHVNDEAGNPLDVGRRRRTIPPALRRALEHRDAHCCRFPGCTSTRHLDAHHIKHWADGGETRLHNLVLLCTHHHRLVHEAGYTLHLAGDASAHFTRPDGSTLPAAPPPRFRGNVFTLEERNRSAGLNPHRMSLHPSWLGERMDYSTAVEHLQGSDGR